MGNMSYCRFENTSRDLRDCLQAIENGELDDLDPFEKDGLESLLEYCETIFFMKEEIEQTIKENENENG